MLVNSKTVRLEKIFEPNVFLCRDQRYTYRVLQTIQMKLILLCVWADRAVFGSAKTTLKFKCEFELANTYTIQCRAGYKLEK
jgi:hypothetical protein